MLAYRFLEQRLQRSARGVLPGADVSSLLVRPCPNPKFGDYQCAAIMSLAKEHRRNPRQLAGEITQRMTDFAKTEPEPDDSGISFQIEGPGFINFRLDTAAVARQAADAVRGQHLFFDQTSRPRTIVIDFSSPNVAKPMHVGHIRSTILGDSLARTFRLLGHHVITDNHIGDWGTQFGKLLVGWKQFLDRSSLQRDPIAEMECLYRTVDAACKSDASLLEQARLELVKLQNNDPENLAVWREMIALSQIQFDDIYRRLGVRFDYALGESFYNPRLKSVVQELCDFSIAQESEGAKVVFFEDNPELKEHPALIQKSDGAANYTTTDLATLEHRLHNWQPDEIIYVTDGRQQLHFKQLFAIFRQWHPDLRVQLVHVWFGAILGEDGKPFKTRTGETIKLTGLLDEAEERALRVVSGKNPELDEAQRREIARVVGIGAIKYADLLPNRQSDYVFSWDKMLALNGNTAPYLQYAYTRVRSIFRKHETDAGVSGVPGHVSTGLQFSAADEITLAKHLLNFGLVVEAVAAEYRPNYLCNYLYELAGHFARFYENCPVLKAAEVERTSRLALCDLTSRVLKQGLDLLGIETLEKM